MPERPKDPSRKLTTNPRPSSFGAALMQDENDRLVFTLGPEDFARQWVYASRSPSSEHAGQSRLKLSNKDEIKRMIESAVINDIAERFGFSNAQKLIGKIDVQFDSRSSSNATFMSVDERRRLCDNIGKYISRHEFNEDYFGEKIKDTRPTSAPEAAFNKETFPRLSIPQDGRPIPYPGKRKAGDIRQFLISTYPSREGGEALTLSWLQQNDSKAYRALYTQSTAETGLPSDFLPSLTTDGDELLNNYGIDMSTDDGLVAARKLYSILSSRLNPRRK